MNVSNSQDEITKRIIFVGNGESFREESFQYHRIRAHGIRFQYMSSNALLSVISSVLGNIKSTCFFTFLMVKSGTL